MPSSPVLDDHSVSTRPEPRVLQGRIRSNHRTSEAKVWPPTPASSSNKTNPIGPVRRIGAPDGPQMAKQKEPGPIGSLSRKAKLARVALILGICVTAIVLLRG